MFIYLNLCLSFYLQNVLKACNWAKTRKDAHHNKVPHASSFGHQCGDSTAARHQDNLDGLGVEKVIEQLGGFSWITLKGQNKKEIKGWTDGQMDRWTDGQRVRLRKKRGKKGGRFLRNKKEETNKPWTVGGGGDYKQGENTEERR